MLEMLEMLLIKKEILLWFPFKCFSLFFQRVLIDAIYVVSIASQTILFIMPFFLFSILF